MERNNRTLWIIVAIAALVMLCCCAAVAAAAVGGWFVTWPVAQRVSIGEVQEGTLQRFEVGEAPSLQVDNFAGSLTIRAGESGEIQVTANKKASSRQDLDRIQIDIDRSDGGLVIKTRKPATFSNASVAFEITAPPGTRLDLDTGAGSIDVRGLMNGVKASTGAGSVTLVDVQGEIEADSGAGSLDVRGATGTVRLGTGAGSIDYLGDPQGDCRFETGAGSITLRLPAALNIEVQLESGMGTISVDYPVDGRVTKQEVEGTIGSGRDGSIYAQTGTGSISVQRR
jgi:hypothetical protein